MKVYKGILLGFFILFSTATLAAEVVPYKYLLRFNVENINKIQIGMTVDEVRSIMKEYSSKVRNGAIKNPWTVERNGNTEIFHYLTKNHPPFTPILENQATPIIFVDGKVVSIGRNYLKSARRSSQVAPQSNDEKSVEERLKELKSLYDQGLIDKNSYEQQRTRILNSI